MMQKSILVAWLAMSVFLSGAGLADADQARQERALAVFQKLQISVPLQSDEKQQAAIVDRLVALQDLHFVYLDLSIDFPASAGGRQSFTPYINGKAMDGGASDCPAGLLPMGPGVTYELGPLADYNHLLLSIFTGARSAFPYNDVSCEYVSGGDHGQMRVRGFFHVMANAIPTAVSLQLRPLTPPFDAASHVLAGK